MTSPRARETKSAKSQIANQFSWFAQFVADPAISASSRVCRKVGKLNTDASFYRTHIFVSDAYLNKPRLLSTRDLITVHWHSRIVQLCQDMIVRRPHRVQPFWAEHQQLTDQTESCGISVGITCPWACEEGYALRKQ
jgi:hypothetical protein